MLTSTMFAPSCSIVVCTRNRPDALDRCLRALTQLTYPHVDVIVVDNAPSDSRAEAIAGRWRARYLVEPTAGLSRARNTGARACSSDIVAFTDDDAVPDPEWLASLIAEFRDPRVAIVTGRTLPLACGSDASPAGPRASDLGPGRITLDRGNPFWFEMACFGGIGRGCNMAFRRSVFDGSPVFDERLGKGVLANGDEHRAFGHLIARGHKAVYTPAAIVRHPFPHTVEELRAHHLTALSDLTGYATFLFLNTEFRWKVARYVLEAALGTRRTWRYRTETVSPDLVPRWRRLVAYARGALASVRARLGGYRLPEDSVPNGGVSRCVDGEASVLSAAQK